METVGVVGGLGPESTIEYYRMLIAAYQRRAGTRTLPQILINSIDVYRSLAMVEDGRLTELADYLAAAVRQLADAGAGFAIISANTPHLVFDEVQQRSTIPLISIVEAACAAVKQQGMIRTALLGTRFTMLAQFYPEVFARAEITLVIPNENEVVYIHDKYINELLQGTFLPETRERLLDIVGRMRRDEHIEGVVLAGTELPLILTGDSAAGIPLFDTTRIHVEAAVARLFS
jgi:aspartate racemase